MKSLFSLNTKSKSLIFCFIAALLFTIVPSKSRAENEADEETDLTFEYIYETLEPFGKWHNTDAFGWVWQPYEMKRGWQPYTLGKWELTEEGWLWISNFDWGWLPFHYGKWCRHKYLDWCWVPEYEWAPAWVVWYWTDNYIGWSPIQPVPPGETFEVDPGDWFFVSYANFFSPYLVNYRISYGCVSSAVCDPYIVVNNYYFNNCYYYDYKKCRKVWVGPPVLVVEKKVKRRIPKKRVVTVKKRTSRKKNGKRKVVEIYRPSLRKPIDKKTIGKLPAKRETIPKEKNKTPKQQERKTGVRTPPPTRLPITPVNPDNRVKPKHRTVPPPTKRVLPPSPAKRVSPPKPRRVTPPSPVPAPTSPATQPAPAQPLNNNHSGLQNNGFIIK